MKRILLPAGGALLASGLLAAGLASTAQASGVVDTKPLTPSSKVAEAIEFWSKAEGAAMKAATVYRYDYKEVNKLVQKGGFTTDTKPGLVGAPKPSASKVHNVNIPKTIGKVFFVDAKGDLRWCSATSIQSNYKNLVATAGHCVYDTAGNKEVLDKWVFVPMAYQGKAPLGIYVGKQAYVHYDFATYEDFDRDYAFVTVYDGIGVGPGTHKQVSFEEFKKYQGIKYDKQVEISRDEYLKCKLDPATTDFCDVVPGSSDEEAGPEHPGAVVDKVEVSKAVYDAAKIGKGQGYKFGEPITEYVTKAQYDAYRGPGEKKVDAVGNYTITHYYVQKWYVPGKATKYVKTIFFIVEGIGKNVGKLGDNAGMQGFAWNQPTGKYVRVFGYPGIEHPDGNKPYTGNTPKWCYGKTSAKANVISALKAEELVSLKCAFTPGANGGPWLYKYSNAQRLGYVNGVTTAAFGDVDGNNRYDTIFSPYFDGETATVYKAAINNWSGPAS
ncbi:hypothetical protein [Thermoactinospora rubra]|uniref:hypothetical protein n=1 Tax=Thermoactinospora rubra TaxID=1088767 RepID=UPI000A10980E|nr:hypothetical protein [Thermoactinospora rubra]